MPEDNQNQNKSFIPEGLNTKAVEVEPLTEGQLKAGYWFVTHKAMLRKIGIGCLIAFIAINFSFVLFALGRYYIFQYAEYQQALLTAPQDQVNYQVTHVSNAVQPLEIISRDLISNGRGKIDIAIRVRNPNTQWALESVDYEFSVGSTIYDAKTAFFLPGEEKYLLGLNLDGVGSGTPQVFFENEDWRRVTRYEDYGPQRLNFLITEKVFSNSRQSELSQQLPISQVSARVTNATPFNYNQVIFQVILISGNRVIGVNQVAQQDMRSRSNKELIARWTQQLGAVTTIEILPDLNILDPTVYVDYEGENIF